MLSCNKCNRRSQFSNFSEELTLIFDSAILGFLKLHHYYGQLLVFEFLTNFAGLYLFASGICALIAGILPHWRSKIVFLLLSLLTCLLSLLTLQSSMALELLVLALIFIAFLLSIWRWKPQDRQLHKVLSSTLFLIVAGGWLLWEISASMSSFLEASHFDKDVLHLSQSEIPDFALYALMAFNVLSACFWLSKGRTSHDR